MYIDNNPELYRDRLGDIIIFKFFREQELDDIIKLCELQVYDEGETVVQEGDVDQSFYAVVDGSVEVTVQEKKRSVYICTIGAGEVFGEAGLFIRVKRTANITTSGGTVLLRIRREEFNQFIRKYPSTGNKLLMVIIYSLLRKLRSANQELAFERSSDVEQSDIDEIVKGLTE